MRTRLSFEKDDKKRSELQKQINRLNRIPQDNNENKKQFKEGGVTKGPSHAQGGTDINVEGGEFIFKKGATKFWGIRTLEAMNRMGGMGMRSPSKPKKKLVKPQYEGGGLVEIKSMFNFCIYNCTKLQSSNLPF